MSEQERKALEQAAEQADTLMSEMFTVWTALGASTTDNGIARFDARSSTITAISRLEDAKYLLHAAALRLA